MKFPVKKCECGLDLTEAVPVRVVRKLDQETDAVVIYGDCPECHHTYKLTESPEELSARMVPGSDPDAEPTAVPGDD